MKFSNYMLAVTYFITSLGLFSLTLIESIGEVFIILNCAAVLLTLIFNLRGRTLLPGGLWGVLALVLLVIFGADYLTGKEDLIVAASRFLAILLPLKLFDLKTRRDHVIVYGTVFFLMLAAAASTVSPLFFIVLSLFIIGTIFAMIVFNIHKELYHESPSVDEVPPGLFDLTFFVTILVVSAFSLVTTFALFFVIPRMGVGFFEVKTLDTVKVSGFSERVSLGSMGTVKKDQTVVMRVELQGGAAGEGPMYLRGTALDNYDGGSWTRSSKRSRLLHKASRSTFSVSGKPGRVDKSGLMEQKILLEPLATDVLFAAPGARYINGRFSNLWADATGAVYLPSPPFSRIEYTVWSEKGGASIAPPAAGPGLNYLQTPYLKGTPEGERFKGLVDGITRGLTTNREKAAAIERYLEANHAYTLSPGGRPGVSPIDDFLFYTKEGYCEHFATAMVMMLRTAGVSARLVTGFLQVEWNGYGNYYIVRQSDAHSWVEARLDKGGWSTLDPTPPAGVMPLKSRSPMLLYLDLMRMKWNRYIINYSFADQTGAAAAVESRTRGVLSTLKEDLLKAVRTKRPSLDSLTFAVAAALLLAALMKLIKKRRLAKEPGARLPSFYTEMLTVLSKMGFKRECSETPLEFARRVGMAQVINVTLAFHKHRYGGRKLPRDEVDRVRRSLTELREKR
jgi:hypothetical protein